ncbi:MAG: DUF4349 domain-containing protein, partial [Planctomycetes bacterium]|nr:DUF4349 domain-containing protein [Planctomycetota bacterium]
MSEHIWVRENFETHIADGLKSDERNRIERHLSGCHECARELAEASALDQALTDLFATARPAPGLESRMIETLRPARRVRRPWVRFVAGMAATILLGLVGYVAQRISLADHLRLPGILAKNISDSPKALSKADLVNESMINEYSKVGGARRGIGIIGGKQKGAGAGEEGREKFAGEASNATGLGDDLLGGTQLDTQKRLKELGSTLEGKSQGKLNIISGLAPAGNPDDGPNPAQGVDVKVYHKPSDKLNAYQIGTYGGDQGREAGLEKRLMEIANLTVKASEAQTGSLMFGAGMNSDSGIQGSVVNAGKQPDRVHLVDDSKSMGAVTKSTVAKPALPGNESAQQGETKKQLQDFAGEPKEAIRKHGAFGEERELSMDFGKGPVYFDPTAKSRRLPVYPVGDLVIPIDSHKDTSGKAQAEGGRGEAKGEPKDDARKKVQDAEAYNKDTNAKPGGGEKKDPPQQPEPVPASRKIIRTGDVEFEIDQFDAGVAAVTKLINAIPGAFIATINSDKLANGKVKGSIVVRMPPERLDKFLLDLRGDFAKTGDLKNQRIGSQDITKQYFDLESRLRAARTMEDRLIDIIKKGKGEIKDLLAAERELGVWRTKIEEMEGEIRYFNNQVSLSTLTIALTEKEIRQAASMVISERINMRIETEDVEKSLQTALAAVTGAKGRVLKSDLKLHAAGQYDAILQFEVAPAAADKVRDQLKQLGIVTQHDSERQQQAVGGTETLGEIKSRQSDVQFNVVMYNIADIKPRDTFQLQVAAQDVPAEFRKLQVEAILAKGWVRVAQLNEAD